DLVPAAAVQLMREPAPRAGSAALLELEEMRPYRQDGSRAADERERDAAFRGEQAFPLDLHTGKQLPDLRKVPGGPGVGPAANQGQPGPNLTELLGEGCTLAEDSVQEFGSPPWRRLCVRTEAQVRAEPVAPFFQGSEQGGQERRVPDGDQGEVLGPQ